MSSFNRAAKKRVALFFSGSGSTLQALLDQQEILGIVCAISSRKTASGRLRCRRSSLVEFFCKFPEQEDHVLDRLKQLKINTIFLVGFMKILSAEFIETFKKAGSNQQIFNIHPSLLPDFKGLKATEAAFAQKVDLGVTIHQVVAQVDSGKLFKRKRSLNARDVKMVGMAEAQLWQRASEQDILRTWGSCCL